MMQSEQPQLPPALPPDALALERWIATWRDVRGQFEALTLQYQEQFPAADAYRLEWVLESTDSALRELSHRLSWLKAQLEQYPPAKN